MLKDVTKSKISNSQHTSLEVMRELKEVREAFVSTLCDPEEKVCIKGSDADREILQQALATLDRILNQDEAEMVERVEEAIFAFPAHKHKERAKAALRAVGLIPKEGE